MPGKGDKRRKGANDALYLKNNPFPSLLERRKERERQDKGSQKPTAERAARLFVKTLPQA